MRRPPYDCELDERKLHVFLDGAKVCLCCLRANSTMKRCKHRPPEEKESKPKWRDVTSQDQ